MPRISEQGLGVAAELSPGLACPPAPLTCVRRLLPGRRRRRSSSRGSGGQPAERTAGAEGQGPGRGRPPLRPRLPLRSFLRSAPALPVAALEGARLGLFPLSGTATNFVADATAFPARPTSFRAQKEASAQAWGCPPS